MVPTDEVLLIQSIIASRQHLLALRIAERRMASEISEQQAQYRRVLSELVREKDRLDGLIRQLVNPQVVEGTSST
jgi:hypothetical protein